MLERWQKDRETLEQIRDEIESDRDKAEDKMNDLIEKVQEAIEPSDTLLEKEEKAGEVYEKLDAEFQTIDEMLIDVETVIDQLSTLVDEDMLNDVIHDRAVQKCVEKEEKEKEKLPKKITFHLDVVKFTENHKLGMYVMECLNYINPQKKQNVAFQWNGEKWVQCRGSLVTLPDEKFWKEQHQNILAQLWEKRNDPPVSLDLNFNFKN